MSETSPLRSIGHFLVVVILCSISLVVFSYAQFILCWGLKIVGWIEHYILFGWLLDKYLTGIFTIIPFVLDLTSYGVYGLFVGLLPANIYYGIAKEYECFSFSQWIVYVFQLAMFLAVLVINNDTCFDFFNSFLTLDKVPFLTSLAKVCDWGQYANSTFVWMFCIGNLLLLIPRYAQEKLLKRLKLTWLLIFE